MNHKCMIWYDGLYGPPAGHEESTFQEDKPEYIKQVNIDPKYASIFNQYGLKVDTFNKPKSKECPIVNAWELVAPEIEKEGFKTSDHFKKGKT